MSAAQIIITLLLVNHNIRKIAGALTPDRGHGVISVMPLP